ncbi:WXG100 family type VII secretion target [Actinoplanes derwentensis]|uniref:WXG100 family type VII secretion target n=1 Tax=Actinoplanes derwentensis TaxID=113562 RepID=A0A1H2C885_9ACTN|nr:hypothetical protein [Actinoplanes derwentensis]GID86515.1 hypothetical protein Ade03nite_54390 [Actinoplanes derwentensis]SDT66755.1 hypothetical protein SAMN04489716_5385 [Actinoplanes derwentensis]
MNDNPLIAQAQSSTTWSTGLGLIEDARQISDGIHDNSWVDATLGGVGGSLDTLAVAIDPLGSMMAWGVSWLLEHVKPLKDALDWLAGQPDEIAAHAATWRNVAASVAGTHERYAAAVRTQTSDWYGASGDAYRAHAAEQIAAVEGIATVTNAISYAVEGAGLLVGLVRETVRDLIAQFVATLAVRLPQWLAAEGVTLGLATPVVVSQVVALVTTWANRIQHFIRALLNSLRRLSGRLDELAGILDRLKQLVGRLSRAEPTSSAPHGGVSLYSRSVTLSNREAFEQGGGLPRTAETIQHYTELAGVDFRGMPVDAVESADDIAYLDIQGAVARTDQFGVQLGPSAFLDEETLVRTLGHESVHVR